MTTNLHYILPSVTLGSTKNRKYDFVNHFSLQHDSPKIGSVRMKQVFLGYGTPVKWPEQPFSNINRCRTRNPDDRQCTFSNGSGDGTNCILFNHVGISDFRRNKS